MGDLEWLKVKGNIAFKQEDYHRALDFYNQGLMNDPDNYSLHCNMAQAYLCIQDYCKAESHAVRAFQIKKDYVKAYYRAAKAAIGSGDRDKALHFIERGVRSCTNPADLLMLKENITRSNSAGPECEAMKDQDAVTTTKNRSSSMPRNDTQSVKINKKQGKGPADSQNAESEDSHHSSKRVADDGESVQDDDKKDVPENAANKVVTTKHRSSSETRTVVQRQKANKRQRKGPVDSLDFKNDAFYQTLKTLSNEVISACTNSPTQSANNTKEHIQSLVKEGSELLEKGLPRKAAEKYKEAHSMLSDVDIQVYGWKEIEYSVLQYALCWSWIEALNYEDIVSSINMLTAVKDAHGPRLPAVHYALGTAFSRLNRYKVASKHIKSGIEFLNKEIVFEAHPWPGTNNIIKETTRSGLQESLNRLFSVCTVHHQPDAVCKYKDCLSTYSHIIPSADIFYSDPDFRGLVVVICQEDCRIQHHLPCWKSFKETYAESEKISDRDMLGMRCPTADCVTSEKVPSVIIKIEIYGEDAEIKSSCSKEVKKCDNVVKDSKKSRKKKERTSTAIEKEPKRRAPKERKLSEQTTEAAQLSSVKLVPETDELSPRVKRLEFLRKINFGFLPRASWNPEKPDYGRSKGDCIEKFKIPEFEEDSSETKGQKSFLYTYFVELLNSEGPIKLQYVIKKWESVDFQEVKTFIPQYDGIIKFLLASCQCAVVEDTMCLAKDVPVAYNTSKTDLVDGLNFTLMDSTSLEDNGRENIFVDSIVNNGSISNYSDKAIVATVSNSFDSSSFSKLENRNGDFPMSNIPVLTPASQENKTTNIGSINDSYAQDSSNKTLIDIGLKSESNYVKTDNRIEIVPKSPNYSIVLECEKRNDKSQVSEMPIDYDEAFVTKTQLSGRKQSNNFMFDELQSNSVEEKLPKTVSDDITNITVDLQSCRESFLVTEQMTLKSDEKKEHLSDIRADDIPVHMDVRNMPGFGYETESNVLPDNVKEGEFVSKSVIAPLHYPHCVFDGNQDWVDESVGDIDVAIAPPPAEFRDETVLPEAAIEQNSAETVDISSVEVPVDITMPALSAETFEQPMKDIMKQITGELEKVLHTQSEEDTDDSFSPELIAKLLITLSKPVQEHESHNIKSQDSLREIIDTLLRKNQRKNISVTSADKSTQVDDGLKLDKLIEISQKEKIILEMKEKLITCRKEKEEMLQLSKQLVNYIKYSEFKKLEIYKTKVLETKELLELVNKSGYLKTGDDNSCESLKKLEQRLTSIEEYNDKLKEWNNIQLKEVNDGNIQNFHFPTPLPEETDSTHNTLVEIFEKLTERLNSNSKGEETKLELDATLDAERSNITNGESEPILDSYTSSPPSHRPYHQYHIPDLNSSTLHRSLATALIYDKSGKSLMDVDFEDEEFDNNLSPVKQLESKELTAPASSTISYRNDTAPHQMKIQMSSEVQDIPKPIPSADGTSLQFGHAKGLEEKNSLVTAPLAHTNKINEFPVNSGIASVTSLPLTFMPRMPVNYMSPTPYYPYHMAMNYPQPMRMPFQYPQQAATFTVPSVHPITTMPKLRAAELNNKNRNKLLNKLRAKFPFKTREEVEEVLSRIRKEKGRSLSGMRVSEIYAMIEKELDKSKKRETGPMGMEKFGGSAWGDVKESVAWAKPQETEVDDCVICMEPLTDGLETLSCNHDFHKKCIRRWFKENRICPLCQVHANVHEEFPPLS